MRQDSRYRTDARSDYMQFSQFLENAKAAREGAACCGHAPAESTGHPGDRSHHSPCMNRRADMGNNGCDEHKTGCCNRPNGCPVGMVYGVSQMWQDIYEVDAGFPRGTIFKELDLPLYRTGCNDKGGCRG